MIAENKSAPRVLFCIYTHNLWGGIEHWLTGLVRYLEREGWPVTVGLARGVRFNDPNAFRAAYPDLATVDFDARTGTPEGRVRGVASVLRALRPDVVIPIGLADVYRAACRVRVSGRRLAVLAPLRALSAELVEDVARFAPVIDLCVGNNPLHARYLERRQVFSPERLRTIVNGVAPPAAPRQGANFAANVPRLLFVGRLHREHKRILELPRLVEELARRAQPFELTIVGDGEGREALLEKLSDERAQGTVRFVGYLPPEQIAREIYPRHDILIHFSAPVGEGCPQVLQQAMAHGVVPVCSEFVGIHSLGFLRHGETCLTFHLGDIERAAAHVRELQRDPALRAAMARRAENAMRSFDINRALRAWRDAIDDARRLPSRDAGPHMHELAAHLPDAGRLQRAGVPAVWADRLRRTLRRYPAHADGWAEWPGTMVVLDEATRMAIMKDLVAIDDEARPVERTANVIA
jgi:glycosyltransferase involved in cell wall biosynthesis